MTTADAKDRITRAALDLFSRVLRGQVEMVEEVLRDYYTMPNSGGPFTLDQLRAFRGRLGAAKDALGLPASGSLGIFNRGVHPAARLAVHMVREMEGGRDPTYDAIARDVDAQWAREHGSPWYGRPTVPAPAEDPTPSAAMGSGDAEEDD